MPHGAAPIPTGSAAARVAAPSSTVDPASADGEDGDDGEELADDVETDGAESSEPRERRPHPLDGLTQHELEERFRSDPRSLGSISLGAPNSGGLVNAVQMPEGDEWELVDPAHAYGSEETVAYLKHAIAKVHERYPDAPKLYIGHISARNGGHLSPHVSHQAGRDVDIGYFYRNDDARWYARATAANLDVERTWALVRALITETDIDLILIDRSLQTLLRRHATEIGEDEAWLADIFEGSRGRRPLILHAKGHATHLHARFYNPIAQETARLTYPLLRARGLVRPPTYYVSHKAKNGETLAMLARKYGVSVPAIKQANGLKKNLIRAGRVYRIPKSGGVRLSSGVVTIPARRLPPKAVRHAALDAAR